MPPKKRSSDAVEDAAAPNATKRGPGRPPGSGKKTVPSAPSSSVAPPRRGHPPGSGETAAADEPVPSKEQASYDSQATISAPPSSEETNFVPTPPASRRGRPSGSKNMETFASTASSSRLTRKQNQTSLTNTAVPRATRSSTNVTPTKAVASSTKKSYASKLGPKATAKPNITKNGNKGKEPADTSAVGEDDSDLTTIPGNIAVIIPCKKQPDEEAEDDEDGDDGYGPSYWLMKAEPESRIEKGKDVKFSIDDLRAATEPEGWDGVRNYVARNNMRLMMKGDMAFFYHSNCKVPGIVGTMEIVREHSVDETAFDPEHPYFDEKSNRENPKWCVVHVEYRQKFPAIIKLKDLQKFAKDGGLLENMQTLKTSRLSVSKVSKKEWDFIMSLVDMEDVAAASAQFQPRMVS